MMQTDHVATVNRCKCAQSDEDMLDETGAAYEVRCSKHSGRGNRSSMYPFMVAGHLVDQESSFNSAVGECEIQMEIVKKVLMNSLIGASWIMILSALVKRALWR